MSVDVEKIIAAVTALSPADEVEYIKGCVQLMHGQDIEFQEAIIAAQDQARTAVESEGGEE